MEGEEGAIGGHISTDGNQKGRSRRRPDGATQLFHPADKNPFPSLLTAHHQVYPQHYSTANVSIVNNQQLEQIRRCH